MAETIKVKGLVELQRAMRELPKRVDRRILNAALMAGARLMVAEAKVRAPVLQESAPNRRPGTLRRNIRAVPVRPREHTATVLMGVRVLKKDAIAAFKKKSGKGGAANPDDPFYWRFVEFGTSKMSARPFIRPAFEVKKRESVDVIKAAIVRRIAAEAEKLKK